MSRRGSWHVNYDYAHPIGTVDGWNYHLAAGSKPCAPCRRGLERDLKNKRRLFLMRQLGNGRYA